MFIKIHDSDRTLAGAMAVCKMTLSIMAISIAITNVALNIKVKTAILIIIF